MPPIPRIPRIGDYVIESQLGNGGMGVVYKAKQISMHRTVALKVLRENLSGDTVYVQRFLHEVRLLACMEHPNMVRVYEGGSDNKFVYFSMEYVEGKDLKHEADAKRFYSEHDLISIAKQVASALNYAWKKDRMIHRDVKPANIMMLPDGTVKLLDLGISKKLTDESTVFATSTGIMVGSPSYMSPEQARSEADIDFRADMYSLGVSLFQIAAGRAPYEGKTTVEVVTQHFSAPIPDVRMYRKDLSRNFARIIRKMMAKNKADRYASWEEVQTAFKELEKRLGKLGKTPTALPRFLKNPRIIIIAVLALMNIAFGLFALLNRQRGVPPQKSVIQEQLKPSAKPDLMDYETLRKKFLETFEERCLGFWNEEQYADGAVFCQKLPIMPEEFREGGRFRTEFQQDEPLQKKIVDRKREFEKKAEK